MSSTLFERTPTGLSWFRQLKVVPGTTRGATDQKVPIEGAFCRFLRSHSSAERRSQSLHATRIVTTSLLTLLLLSSFAVAQAPMSVPVFQITREQSTIKFEVDASVEIIGTFDKWDAALTFTSPDAETAVFDVSIRADSVDTGSSIKNNKLKGKDFFDAQHYPWITFKSTKVVQTSPGSFELDGNFTIRGVTEPEKLTLKVSGQGTGSGKIVGTMAFDRKKYGMNSGIPFIRIADRVQVSVSMLAKRVGGPAVVFKR